MSSAALQSAPYQATTVGSNSPVPATSSGRPYTSGSTHSRDGYYNSTPTNASPSSNRRPAGRPSGNGALPNSNPTSQPQQHYSPSSGNPNSSSVNHRATNSSSHLAASSGLPSSTAPTTGYPLMAAADPQRGVPPVVSPRTSSNRNPAQAAATTAADRSTRRGTHETANYTSRQVATSGDGTTDRVNRQRSNGNTNMAEMNGAGEDAAMAAATAASRTRRRTQQQEALPHRPSSSREPRASESASTVPRQSAASAAPPNGPSREASEVLNRVIVSKPEEDLERERERMAEAVPSSPTGPNNNVVPGPGLVSDDHTADAARGGSRSRQDHAASSKREKHSKFGEYFLGGTLGEGEFGKVKMGWKEGDGIQVAIKLIRRDSVGTNPTRLAKIYREIAILREISHPNIVRLHEMVETEKQIGIILEYASGGELFDYILNHRYLKDNAARRLFAQLVSGVGYLHKKGIVHRDLKLENLLLDRNRNIIITDFGFANTFNADDELGEEIEYNLSSRDFVKRMELDKILPNGHRRGDLMQTSCGSPCYAAPELVVSDSLYTGRKVDVWSCGVILYAMLAGYLPFDDDPANPEGDNINLLYKYIVSTPLTFPEYVTPHARDLLRRILVPDPRKRADLFEVARHSWLSEYSHVVGFITSSTTTSQDIGATAVPSEEKQEAPLLGRSASVREPSKTQKPVPAVGDLARKHGNVDQEPKSHSKTSKDNKRNTLQVEYVAPRSETQRGEASTSNAPPQAHARTRARVAAQGPVEVPTSQAPRRVVSADKPLPQDPSRHDQHARPSTTSSRQQNMPPPSRPGREPPRAVSDTNYTAGHAPPPVSAITRPTTGGSMTSTGSRTGSMHLTSRGSYSQPAAATVAGTNAQGRISQPERAAKAYNISAPMSEADQSQSDFGRPSVSGHVGQNVAQSSQAPGFQAGTHGPEQKGHRRSNTIGGFFGRTNSLFGGKRNPGAPDHVNEKPSKKYPPVSMTSALGREETPRQSMDSRRSISFGFGKKRSGSITGSQSTTLQEKPARRFSLLPGNFSLKSIGIGKDYGTPGDPPNEVRQYDNRVDTGYNETPPPQTARTTGSRNMSGATAYQSDGIYERARDTPPQTQSRRAPSTSSSAQYRSKNSKEAPQFLPPMNFRQDESSLATESESSLMDTINQRRAAGITGVYPPGFNEDDNDSRRALPQPPSSRGARGVLQKNNRKFTEAYEQEQGNGYGPSHVDHGGSSGPARRVMDFFRRRGKDRL